MRIKEIKQLEVVLDISRIEAAAEIGVSKGDLSATLTGKRRNPQIRERYVELLRSRITVERVFDDKFDRSVEEEAA